MAGGYSHLVAEEDEILREEMEDKADKVYSSSADRGHSKVGSKNSPPHSGKIDLPEKFRGDLESGFKKRYEELLRGPTDPMENAQGIIDLYKEVLKFHDWERLLEKGRESLMAQQIMEVKVALPILPDSLDRNFVDRNGLEALKKNLEKLDRLLKGLPSQDILAVTFFVRQSMIDGLIDKSSLPSAFSVLWKGSLRQQSNVTEEPEGQQNVSKKSGASMNNYLRLGWELLDRDWGEPSLEMRISDRRYEDEQFESRETSSFFLKGKVVMDRLGGKKKLVQSMTPSFGLRFDYVDDVGNRKLNSFTYAPSLDMVLRPKRGWGKWSDLFVSFLNFAVERRIYQPGFNLGSAQEDKDASTFGMTWIGVNFDRYGDWRVRETAVLSLKKLSSDDPNLDYLTFSLDFSVAFERGKYGIKPSLAYRMRDQDSYLLQGRKDDRFEAGVVGTRNFPKFESSLGIKLVDQDSNQSNLSFVDLRFALGITRVF